MKQSVDNFTPDLFVARSCDQLFRPDAKTESARDIDVSGSQSEHRPSTMNVEQVQDYITLVVSKANQLGEHYVARQITWGATELDRLEGRS